MELSRYQIRIIIYFQFCCKKSATEYHQIMCTAFGINFVSYDAVKVCYRKLKKKVYDFQETELSGLPTDVDEVRLRGIVEDVNALPISRAMHRINLTYKIKRWVPHELTQANKDRCVRACTNLFEYQCKDKILDSTVTCDEKWIYFNNTSRKKVWYVPGEPVGTALFDLKNDYALYLVRLP